MSLRDQVNRVIMRREVDAIDRGHDHISAMRERERERSEGDSVRRAAPTAHPDIFAAARRRLRLIK